LKLLAMLIFRVTPMKEDTFLPSILLSPSTSDTEDGPIIHTLFFRWAMSDKRVVVSNFQAMLTFISLKFRRS
jgi:hypothetical protein